MSGWMITGSEATLTGAVQRFRFGNVTGNRKYITRISIISNQ